MERSLNLPEPVYDALAQAASAIGTTPEGWIVANLPKGVAPNFPPGAKTMADVFRGRTGRIASGGEVTYSENCGEHFAEGLEQKRREGRL
jgi:hypothetical protein